MKKFLTVFAALGLAFCVSTATASAAEQTAATETPIVDDGFGSSFFTASTPDALQDNGGSEMMLSGADDALAEELGNIAPAAGGEDLFILPAEDEAAVNPGSEELAAPVTAPVPGMDPTPIQ
jgi:hypothetical protein